MSGWLFEAMRDRMNCLDGGAVLGDLNRLAVERGDGALTTAAVAAFYRRDSQFYFSYAGHHPMLVLRQGRKCWERVDVTDGADAGNLPLGILPDISYAQAHQPLQSGDRFAIYTDGTG